MSDKPKPKPGPRCSATTAAGTRCRKPAQAYSDRCAHHSFRIPGRPSKLTPEAKDTIVAALLEGNYLETAAALAGVSVRGVYGWLARADDVEAAALEHFDGDTAPTGDALYNYVNPDDWPYLDFSHALKAAEAWSERELLGMVKRALPGWQAHMTMLERRHPNRWGRRDRLEVDSKSDASAPRSRIVSPGSEERRREIASVLAEALERPAEADTANSPTEEE